MIARLDHVVIVVRDFETALDRAQRANESPRSNVVSVRVP